ncbi:hypothetical protein LZ554_000589 [Drepanopeziza brunnea f. sp. 'monogermtubi']|nr:hypothetical protein LZ554_000589 [Drepanopeziza brunnea f. sp. 'monogermtubi']
MSLATDDFAIDTSFTNEFADLTRFPEAEEVQLSVDIRSILESGDPIRIADLNSKRRMAGEKMISRLLSSIDTDALRSRLQALRKGMKCQIEFPDAQRAYCNSRILGGCNYHGSVIFADGEECLARFRLPNQTEPPTKEKNFDGRSEFATYKYLAGAGIPVPAVFDIADDGDPLNLVGAGYILFQKLQGRPMDWASASGEQKTNFSRQLAEVYVKLEQHPFRQLGRLQLSSSGEVEVGPAFFEYDSRGEPVPKGPYANSNDCYRDLILHQVQLLHMCELLTSLPNEMHRLLKAVLESLPNNGTSELYLRHVDSRDVNFLVDDNYSITGVIGWELSITAHKASAFQPPLLMYDVCQLYYEGLSAPSEDEIRFMRELEAHGASILAEYAVQKLHFRLEMILETDKNNRDRFVDIFGGWWKLTKGKEVFEWDTGYEEAKREYSGMVFR